MDLDGAVVTADAMHTQVDTAQWITRRGGHYLLTPLGNQKNPAPYSQGPALEERPIHLPGRHRTRAAGAAYCQGRRGPAWVDFPAAAQVLQVRHTRTTSNHKNAGGSSRAKTTGRKTSVEVVYLICSLPMTDAQPQQVTAWTQGHRRIENRPHWIRDVIFDENRHQLRTTNGPQIMATLRNLAISLIRLFHGAGISIASTTRSLPRQPKRAIKLLTPPPPKPTLPTPWRMV